MQIQPSAKIHDELPVVEVFRTIQGEGYHTGKAALFIRLAGCDICCNWCDSRNSWNTNLWPKIPLTEIVQKIIQWEIADVIISGGEPLQHNLAGLTSILHLHKRRIFLETSGAYPLSGKWDWICLSPKKNAPPVQSIYAVANELKVVITNPTDLIWAEEQRKSVSSNCLLYLQPEWSVKDQVIPLVTDYILENPVWMLSLQSHKYIGIP